MSDANRKRKSRDKQFYVQQAKRNKLAKFSLVPGIKGFLLFCNKHEKEAIREGYRVLNEFADKANDVLNDEGQNAKEEEPSLDLQTEDEIDVDQALDAERQALAREHQLPSEEKRFQVVESGAQNVLFIRTTWKDPVQLAMDVMNAILASGEQKTRYLLRLLPVEATCKSQETAIERTIQTILPRWFKDKSDVSYAVQFKCRLNSNLNKDHITRMIGRLVRQVNDSAKVDFKNPDFTIMVEVMKGNCCLGVLPKYAHYRKYNLIELASSSNKKQGDSKGEINDSSTSTTECSKSELNDEEHSKLAEPTNGADEDESSKSDMDKSIKGCDEDGNEKSPAVATLDDNGKPVANDDVVSKPLSASKDEVVVKSNEDLTEPSKTQSSHSVEVAQVQPEIPQSAV